MRLLDSALGIRLLLWAGDPLPTPRPELAEPLRSAEVTNDDQTGDGFQLTFALTKNTVGAHDLLDVLPPMSRVWVGVALGVVPVPLIDGFVTRHDVNTSDEPGGSTLTVTGTDVTTKLANEERSAGHPNQPDSVIVTKILASYPELGLVPAVTPTTDIPIELRRTPHQQETDLAFIRRAAERNGFVFYVAPVTFGVNTAYWGPEVRAGVPQPGLFGGTGPSANVRDLSFGHDVLAPEGVSATFVEPLTKALIPLPPLPPLRVPPLSASPTPAHRTRTLRAVGNLGPIQAALASLAAATRAAESVEGRGVVDTARYGHVLRARGIVGVGGMGLDYDGFYYVRSVTHVIETGSYTQRFTLSREGTGTFTPVVPT